MSETHLDEEMVQLRDLFSKIDLSRPLFPPGSVVHKPLCNLGQQFRFYTVYGCWKGASKRVK
jgi:hypothetical protein